MMLAASHSLRLLQALSPPLLIHAKLQKKRHIEKTNPMESA
jgi:hypothetical protein